MKIIELELTKTKKRAEELGFTLEITDELKSHLVEVGYDPQYGARPLKRALQKWIDDYVTEFIIENDPKSGSILKIDYESENDRSMVSDLSKIEIKTTKRKKKE